MTSLLTKPLHILSSRKLFVEDIWPKWLSRHMKHEYPQTTLYYPNPSGTPIWDHSRYSFLTLCSGTDVSTKRLKNRLTLSS
jgi:hypothetical protein